MTAHDEFRGYATTDATTRRPVTARQLRRLAARLRTLSETARGYAGRPIDRAALPAGDRLAAGTDAGIRDNLLAAAVACANTACDIEDNTRPAHRGGPQT